MGLDVNKLSLPVQHFEVNLDDRFSDDRFQKIKVWVAHTGENLNNSSFSIESLTKMSKTLPYTPIVGYVKYEDGVSDFDGHNSKITIEEDGIKIEYLPKPYGFIPENPNSKIEYRDGKEWLTAEGYMWNKFPEGIEIIKKSMGSKSQSMEIDNVVGEVSNEGILKIDDARFSALCILGDDVSPAMNGSTIEMFSLKDSGSDFKQVMKQMIEEYSEKGEKKVEDNKEVVEETSATESEQVSEVEEPKTPIEEANEKAEEVNKTLNEEDKVDEDEKEDEGLEVEAEFPSTEEPEAKLVDEDTQIEAEIDAIEANVDAQTQDFTKSILSMQSKIDALEAENKELKAFKANIEKAEKISMLESYSERLGKSNIESISEKVDEYTIEQLEREIAFCILKAEQESEAEDTAKVKSYNFNKNELTGRYGAFEQFFQ